MLASYLSLHNTHILTYITTITVCLVQAFIVRIWNTRVIHRRSHNWWIQHLRKKQHSLGLGYAAVQASIQCQMKMNILSLATVDKKAFMFQERNHQQTYPLRHQMKWCHKYRYHRNTHEKATFRKYVEKYAYTADVLNHARISCTKPVKSSSELRVSLRTMTIVPRSRTSSMTKLTWVSLPTAYNGQVNLLISPVLNMHSLIKPHRTKKESSTLQRQSIPMLQMTLVAMKWVRYSGITNGTMTKWKLIRRNYDGKALNTTKRNMTPNMNNMMPGEWLLLHRTW